MNSIKFTLITRFRPHPQNLILSHFLELASFCSFLNEDRHTHNIAVLMNGAGMFKYCPIFDNGGGLLSDTTLDYPLGEDPFDLIKEVQAKTVSSDFDEQLDASERLYGCNLKFFFTKRDADKLVKQATGYSDEVKERVQTLLHRQIDKYAYLIHTS